MAYEFNGTTQYLSVSSAPITALPLTMAAWFNSDSITTGQVILSLDNGATAFQGYRLIAAGTVAGDPLRADTGGAIPNVALDSSIGYTANTWNHAAGVFTQPSVSVSLNGSVNSTTSNFTMFPTVNRFNIGIRLTSGSPGIYLDGRMAEVGIWNAALTAAEIASLAKGMTCDKVRPQSLVFYAPLVRDLIDVKGGVTITNNNATTVANHTRVYA
jgi:hypothetical protein